MELAHFHVFLPLFPRREDKLSFLSMGQKKELFFFPPGAVDFSKLHVPHLQPFFSPSFRGRNRPSFPARGVGPFRPNSARDALL